MPRGDRIRLAGPIFAAAAGLCLLGTGFADRFGGVRAYWFFAFWCVVAAFCTFEIVLYALRDRAPEPPSADALTEIKERSIDGMTLARLLGFLVVALCVIYAFLTHHM